MNTLYTVLYFLLAGGIVLTLTWLLTKSVKHEKPKRGRKKH